MGNNGDVDIVECESLCTEYEADTNSAEHDPINDRDPSFSLVSLEGCFDF